MKPIAIILSLFTAVAGGAVGYFVGKGSVETAAPTQDPITIVRGTKATPEGIKKKEGDGAESDGEGSVASASGGMVKSLKELMKTPGQLQRIEELIGLAKSMGPEGLEQLFDEMSEMGRGPDQIVAMQILLARYAEIDPAKALSFVGDQNGMARFFGSSSILRTWAASDPAEAAAHYLENIDSFSNNMTGGRMAGSVAMEWAKNDPDGAWEWVGKLPEDQQRDAYQRVIQQLVTTDPQTAIGYALKLEEGDMQTRMLGEVADEWARSEPQAAMDWALTLEGDAQTRAIEETMETWARDDPEAALTAWSSLPEGEGRSDSLGDIVRAYTFDEPVEAAAWVNTVENPEEKVAATSSLMGTWLRTDSEAASAWLAEQPVGDTKDAGINQIISSRDLMRDDPGGAIAWANEFSNDDQRLTATTGIAATALVRDRESGEAIVQEAALPQSQKDALLMLEDDQLREAVGLYRAQSGGGGGGGDGRGGGGGDRGRGGRGGPFGR